MLIRLDVAATRVAMREGTLPLARTAEVVLTFRRVSSMKPEISYPDSPGRV